jgi:hypothetical protein
MHRIVGLGRLGIEKVQFEVVLPLGRLATIARRLNPLGVDPIIRADTIRRYGNTYSFEQRHARLSPQEGYLLPPDDLSSSDELRRALFPNGTTSVVMKWDQFEKGEAYYFGWSPPYYAYCCYESADTKFAPQNSEERFENRNCIPVWGRSLRPLSEQTSAHYIESLTKQVEALAVYSQVEAIVTEPQ